MHTDEAKQKAATLLAKGHTVRAVAGSCNVHERTLYQWLSRDDEFKQLITTIRYRLIHSMGGRLALMGASACKAVTDCLRDDMPPMVRLKAADSVLREVIRYMESLDTRAELEQLRGELAVLKGGTDATSD